MTSFETRYLTLDYDGYRSLKDKADNNSNSKASWILYHRVSNTRAIYVECTVDRDRNQLTIAVGNGKFVSSVTAYAQDLWDDSLDRDEMWEGGTNGKIFVDLYDVERLTNDDGLLKMKLELRVTRVDEFFEMMNIFKERRNQMIADAREARDEQSAYSYSHPSPPIAHVGYAVANPMTSFETRYLTLDYDGHHSLKNQAENNSNSRASWILSGSKVSNDSRTIYIVCTVDRDRHELTIAVGNGQFVSSLTAYVQYPFDNYDDEIWNGGPNGKIFVNLYDVERLMNDDGLVKMKVEVRVSRVDDFFEMMNPFKDKREQMIAAAREARNEQGAYSNRHSDPSPPVAQVGYAVAPPIAYTGYAVAMSAPYAPPGAVRATAPYHPVAPYASPGALRATAPSHPVAPVGYAVSARCASPGVVRATAPYHPVAPVAPYASPGVVHTKAASHPVAPVAPVGYAVSARCAPPGVVCTTAASSPPIARFGYAVAVGTRCAAPGVVHETVPYSVMNSTGPNATTITTPAQLNIPTYSISSHELPMLPRSDTDSISNTGRPMPPVSVSPPTDPSASTRASVPKSVKNESTGSLHSAVTKTLPMSQAGLFKKDDFTDCVIHVMEEDCEFHVDKAVLGRQSPVLKDLIVNAKTAGMVHLVMENVVPLEVVTFLRVLYDRERLSFFSDDWKALVAIYKLAHAYGVHDLLHSCEDFLCEIPIDAASVRDLMGLAAQCGLSFLMERCVEVARKLQPTARLLEDDGAKRG